MSSSLEKHKALLAIIEAARTVGWYVGFLNPFDADVPIEGVILGTPEFMQNLVKVPVKVYGDKPIENEPEVEESTNVFPIKKTLQ